MDLHEYQAKEILAQFAIPITPFKIAGSMQEVEEALDELAINEAVLKVQVHAGGRGKAGGVKLARSREEILKHAKKMIGMRVVTKQTTSEGVVSQKILISPITEIEHEYYLGVVIDRKKGCSMLIASPEGGVEIEEVADKTPEKILTIPIDLQGKIYQFRLLQLAKFMGWQGETAKQGMRFAAQLAKVFVATDASLLEINPLCKTPGKTPEGDLFALDAKLSVDDNALFRQKQIQSYYDPTQLNSNEREARKHDLAYVALEGSVGCMVNGAGLAMATMDLIQHHGGLPANFLDVGGSADVERVTEGFKIILSDKHVKAILVNIFGGIMNCATIAEGILAASKQLSINVPLVVRMEGTNVVQGRKILDESGLNIQVAKNLTEAAQLAVGSV